MRFGSPPERRPARPGTPSGGLRPSLRLAALLAGLMLVIGMMARLGQPETHRAIGRALGEPAAAAVVAPLDASPPLVPPESFADVRDNAPFRGAEQAAWFQTLAAVRDAEDGSLTGRSVGAVGYATLNTQPDAYRGRVVAVAGRVMRVERVDPAENDLGIEALWRVTMQPAGGEVWPITVYALDKPAPADEPYDASAVGVFFKKLSYRWAEGVGSTPVVVALRLQTTLAPTPREAPTEAVAATPEADFASPEHGSMGHALLESLGYDLALFDKVTDQQRLRSGEIEAFYQLLAAVEKTPASQLVRLARAGLGDYVERRVRDAGVALRDRQVVRSLLNEQERGRYSVVPLFLDAAAERGELVVVDANVRRAVWVDAGESDAASALGIDGYFELEAFPEDSQNLPLVFVVRELPAGFPVGDAIRQPARLAGFFFKQWAYRTRRRADTGGDRRQFAPLLVGRAPIALALPDSTSMRPGAVIGLLATVGLVGVAVALWRLGRRDRQFETATLARFRAARADATLDFDRLQDLADPPGR